METPGSHFRDRAAAWGRVREAAGLPPGPDTPPPLAGGSFLEALSRLPREVTGHRILGKSVGDLVKEAAVSGSVGALFRIGLGTAGVGGIALGAGAGAGVSGIKEHFKRTNETWARMRTEQRVGRLNKRDTLKGFFNPDQKVSIAFAIGRGAVFGAGGGVVGEWLAETPVGTAIKEGFSKVGETAGTIGRWRESWEPQLPSFGQVPPAEVPAELPVPAEVQTPTSTPEPTKTVTPEPTKTATSTTSPSPIPPTHEPALVPAPATPTVVIEAGPNSPEIKLPDDAQQWMREANDINKEYGLMKQAEVGAMLPKIDEFLRNTGFTEASPDYENIRDHLIGVAEVKVNEVFDSHLQEAVVNRMILDQVHNEWSNDFRDWVGSVEMGRTMTDSLNSLQEGIVKIDHVVADPTSIELTLPGAGQPFEQMFAPYISSDETVRRNAGIIGANIAANYEVLNEGWRKIHPGVDFPVHIGEIGYIVNLAINNDPTAIQKLKLAFSGLTPDQQFRVLSTAGFANIWEVLAKIK